MPDIPPDRPLPDLAVARDLEVRAAWAGVSAAFASLGRAFICADRAFRVVHASATLDAILGQGASEAAAGRPLEMILGADLFGDSGALRAALLRGETREGWRAHARIDDGEHHLVSLTAAPFTAPSDAVCDPRVAYVVVLRPADHERGAGLGAPTVISGMIGRSPAMSRVFSFIENLQHSEVTVLITGESGTGKEVVARAFHEHSSRRKGPFVAVNCGALPPDLLESEMFGHVRGAFTGAVRDREGRFEYASEGTLFLDEIGDLPRPLQVKLLRALNDGSFQRLGENVTRHSRARVIAATHVDLALAVQEGRFRDDLYYRLRVVPIDLPPLRDRREDIEPLARTLLARVGQRQGRSLLLSPDALRVLLQHDWPGNVRELENTLEFAVAVCRGQTILPEDLPELSARKAPVLPGHEPSRPPAPASGAHHRAGTGAPDPAQVRRTLESHRWHRGKTARALGVSRATLWRWMRETGLDTIQ